MVYRVLGCKLFLREQPKPLHLNRVAVYLKPSTQPSFPNFLIRFEEELKAENSWVILAELITWGEFEAQYA